jgi:hypothetical protein
MNHWWAFVNMIMNFWILSNVLCTDKVHFTKGGQMETSALYKVSQNT